MGRRYLKLWGGCCGLRTPRQESPIRQGELLAGWDRAVGAALFTLNASGKASQA
jgi:hypothetical protein